jgi:hypothetical protein
MALPRWLSVSRIVGVLLILSIAPTLVLHFAATAPATASASATFSGSRLRADLARHGHMRVDMSRRPQQAGEAGRSVGGVDRCIDVRSSVAKRLQGQTQVADELACQDVDDTGRYAADCADVTIILQDDAPDGVADRGSGTGDTGDSGTGDTGDSGTSGPEGGAVDEEERINFSGLLLNGREFALGQIDMLRLQLHDGSGEFSVPCLRATFLFFNRPPHVRRQRVNPPPPPPPPPSPPPDGAVPPVHNEDTQSMATGLSSIKAEAGEAVGAAVGGSSIAGATPLDAEGRTAENQLHWRVRQQTH